MYPRIVDSIFFSRIRQLQPFYSHQFILALINLLVFILHAKRQSLLVLLSLGSKFLVEFERDKAEKRPKKLMRFLKLKEFQGFFTDFS